MPDEPASASARNSERPSRKISSRTLVRLLVISLFGYCLRLWQGGQAVITKGPMVYIAERNRGSAVCLTPQNPPWPSSIGTQMGFGMPLAAAQGL